MYIKKNLCGFTLVELMIVIAVVAIIVSIAYPSFQEQIRKGRRADCHNSLVELASLQERFHDEFGAYTTSITGNFVAGGGLGVANNISNEGFYTLSAATEAGGNNQTFLLTCTPVVGGPQNGDRCGNLTLNHLGDRNNSTAVASDVCW